MIKREPNKFRIEKVLHKYIRDLPEARKISNSFERGLLSIDSALTEIAEIIREERSKS